LKSLGRSRSTAQIQYSLGVEHHKQRMVQPENTG
jgi:hypothetical protein